MDAFPVNPASKPPFLPAFGSERVIATSSDDYGSVSEVVLHSDTMGEFDIMHDVEQNQSPQETGKLRELWNAIKHDYAGASWSDKATLMAAGALQVWNQGRFQQAVTIPAAIDVYMNSGGNEIKAAGFFAAANYLQGFGIAASGGGAMRKFPQALSVFRKNYPKSVEYAKTMSKSDKRSYTSGLIQESATGQSTGPLFPFVAGEVLSDPDISTKQTLISSERVARRIGVFSGILGYVVLKLTETYPDNAVTENVVEWAQKSVTWFAVGALTLIPVLAKSGIKKLRENRNDSISQPA